MCASRIEIVFSVEYSESVKKETDQFMLVGLCSCVIWYHIGKSG